MEPLQSSRLLHLQHSYRCGQIKRGHDNKYTKQNIKRTQTKQQQIKRASPLSSLQWRLYWVVFVHSCGVEPALLPTDISARQTRSASLPDGSLAPCSHHHAKHYDGRSPCSLLPLSCNALRRTLPLLLAPITERATAYAHIAPCSHHSMRYVYTPLSVAQCIFIFLRIWAYSQARVGKPDKAHILVYVLVISQALSFELYPLHPITCYGVHIEI